MADPLSYFLFQPVLHDWCNKGRGMCYPVCGMVLIKEHLLLIGKSSPCNGSGFPISLSEWSFTICLTPYNRKLNVLSASLNKTFPSFLQYLRTPYLQMLRARRTTRHNIHEMFGESSSQMLYVYDMLCMLSVVLYIIIRETPL